MSDTDFVLEYLFTWMRRGAAADRDDSNADRARVDKAAAALHARLARDAETDRAMAALREEAAAGMAAPSVQAALQFGHALMRSAQEDRAFPHTLELLIGQCRAAQAPAGPQQEDARGPVPDGPGVFAAYVRFAGPDNPAIVNARARLIGYLDRPENLRVAASVVQGMLTDCEKSLGTDHTYTQTVREHLARFMALTGHSAAGGAAFEALGNLCGKHFGEDISPRIQESISGGLVRYLSEGEAAGAGPVDDLLDVCVQVLGAEHPLVLTGRDLTDCLRRGAVDPAQPAEAIEAPLTSCLRTLGREHPVTLSIRRRLTTPLAEAAGPAAAAGALKSLLADCLFLLPPQDSLTQDVERMLGYWLVRVDDPVR